MAAVVCSQILWGAIADDWWRLFSNLVGSCS